MNDCSGGDQTDGKKCFSARLMWRDGGVGEGEFSFLSYQYPSSYWF